MQGVAPYLVKLFDPLRQVELICFSGQAFFFHRLSVASIRFTHSTQSDCSVVELTLTTRIIISAPICRTDV